MMAKIDKSQKTVSIVSRAASILKCFDSQHKSIRLAELAALLSLPKPTVFRIALTLTQEGLLEQDPETGAYSLGFTSLRFSESLLASLEVRSLARPIMERVRNELNETVVLSVRNGDFRFNIDSVESTQAIGQTQQIGVPIPLYAGAASRVMLAAMDQNELDAYLEKTELKAFSDITLTDIDSLRMEVEATRKRGYVLTAGEFTPGSRAIACLLPVPKELGLAALHVSAPQIRFRPSLERQAVAILKAEFQRSFGAPEKSSAA